MQIALSSEECTRYLSVRQRSSPVGVDIAGSKVTTPVPGRTLRRRAAPGCRALAPAPGRAQAARRSRPVPVRPRCDRSVSARPGHRSSVTSAAFTVAAAVVGDSRDGRVPSEQHRLGDHGRHSPVRGRARLAEPPGELGRERGPRPVESARLSMPAPRCFSRPGPRRRARAQRVRRTRRRRRPGRRRTRRHVALLPFT